MRAYESNSPTETEALGQEISAHLKAGDVVAFYGPLGAGKTAFARGLLRGLGYTQNVTSPTFTIVNEYRGGRLDCAHFDMYRIEDEDGLYSTGFYDYLDGRFVLLIEWSEHIDWAIGDGAIRIAIAGSGDQARHITIEGLEL